MRICIVGLGGVGGFMGVHLAQYASSHSNTEVYFYVTPHSLPILEENGLHLESKAGNIIVQPSQWITTTAEVPIMDLIIFATKSYDFEKAIEQVKPIVHPHTRLLPFLNGISSESILRKHFPNNIVWNGFCFIYSKKKNPFTIEEFGNSHEFVWSTPQNGEMETAFQNITSQLPCKVTFDEKGRFRQWKKFFYISTVATLGTYHNANIGELRTHYRDDLLTVLDEFLLFANQNMKQEGLEKSFTLEDKEDILQQIDKSNSLADTSLQRDYIKNPTQTELDNLTGIVANALGEESLYHTMYQTLKKKTV